MTSGYDWTGRVGDAWAAEWRRTDRSLADLARHLDAEILSAAPSGPFRALDIGCGAGATSLALAAARPDATIVGVDLSPGLVDVARDRAVDENRLPPRRRPGSSLDDRRDWAPAFAGERMAFISSDVTTTARDHAPFDLLCSRHGVMFFDDPVAAFTGLRAAANPGATLVFSCFADWSENAFATALAAAVGSPPPERNAPGPFAFQDRDRAHDVLTAAGWHSPSAERVRFTYRAGEGEGESAVADALSFLQRIGPAASALRDAPPDARARLIDRVTDVIADHRVGNAIDFPALAWIWSAKA